MAVDTGSKDGSAELLADAFGSDCVVALPTSTSFPAALRAGLAHLDELGVDTEWVWVLHDDASPHPEALLALLAGAADDPGADVLGPMLREWPSLKRLLEFGVTISATGRRETGLERGEYDQGQYSEPRAVLAVNTAGMLVRRRVLDELGGLDDELPIFGNDLDFGWRAAAAGHRTVVVPQAVVFHAEAAHRGLRRTALTGRHTHYQERRAALFTLLANSRSRLVAAQAAPARARARCSGCSASWRSGRRARRSTTSRRTSRSVASPRDLLRGAAVAPARRADRRPGGASSGCWPRPGCPTGTAWTRSATSVAALTQQASDVAERRRAAAAELDPSSFAARRTEQLERLEDEEIVEDTGLVARFLTNPVAVLLAVVVRRDARGRPLGAWATSPGPGSRRPPTSWRDWWSLHLSSWHKLGLGTAVRRRRTCCRWRCWRPSSAPARRPRSRRCWCSPCRSRCGAPGGSCAWPAGWPRPRAPNRWLILWGATTYALVPVVCRRVG